MKKLLILSLALVLCCSCNKEQKDQLAQLQEQKAELESKETELPEQQKAESSDFSIQFENEYCWVDAGGSMSVNYQLSSPGSVEVTAGNGWSASVTSKDDESGSISITAPDPASPGIITVKATGAKGEAAESFLQVFVRKPYNQVKSPQIDVHAYYGFGDEQATPENFQRLVDAGVTMLTVEGDWEPWLDWRKHCRLAEEYGIKVVLFISGSAGNYSSDPEHDKSLENKVREAITYPAVYAFQIADEPHTDIAYRLAAARQRIEELAPGYPVYINLHPSSVSQAGMGATTYEEYVNYFARVCNLTFITFDQYPIFTWGIEDCWYNSLNIVYDVCHRYGIPFWAFIQSCREGGRVDPSLETLRLQGNINVAYGAQCNQYFVWVNTSGTGYAPFVANGYRRPDGTWVNPEPHYTQAYYDCKEYDRELHNREFVFAQSNVHKVRHLGVNYYLHGSCLTREDLPDAIGDISAGGSALVSFVGNSGNEYVVICNKTYLEKLPVEVEFTREVYTIDREGTFTEQQPGKTRFTIDEGDMLVIKWQ